MVFIFGFGCTVELGATVSELGLVFTLLFVGAGLRVLLLGLDCMAPVLELGE